MKVRDEGQHRWCATRGLGNLQQDSKPPNSPLKVLDIGTGTGVIALVITQRCEGNALVTGIDIDLIPSEAKRTLPIPLGGVLTARNISFQEFAADYGRTFRSLVSIHPIS